MSEPPITPFPAPAGLAMVGEDDAGACVDGVCVVPSTHADADADPEPAE